MNPKTARLNMEEGDHNDKNETSSSAGAPSGSRWNPTKEQITVLESLYEQGIRTPSADQIRQITARLKAYGQIEGKNVFYWFQNHKARQRQKQKQETCFVNRYLHKNSHLFHPPPPPHCSNVVCSPPYYLQQCDLGFYPQPYPNLLLPAGAVVRRPRPDKLNIPTRNPPPQRYNFMVDAATSYDIDKDNGTTGSSKYYCSHETLDLFPLHPTGSLLQEESTTSSSAASNGTTPLSSPQGCGQRFFDFLSVNGTCESD